MTKGKRILVAIMVLLLFGIIVELFISNSLLKTTAYTLQLEQIDNDVNIIFLSDLHNDSFGVNNENLIQKVKSAKPDIIAMVGDMMQDDSTKADLAEYKSLLMTLAQIAPTFVSYGNHDLEYEKTSGIDLAQEVAQTGATFLDESYVDIVIGESQIRIGGMYAYAFLHHQTPDEWTRSATYAFLSEFENTNFPTVLLCHRPDSFFYYDAYLDWDIDVILCGHTHGGIVRIPFLGGMIAPDQGFFPEYDYGEYHLDDTVMLISSGLDGYGIIPRFFNRPEIAKLTLTS